MGAATRGLALPPNHPRSSGSTRTWGAPQIQQNRQIVSLPSGSWLAHISPVVGYVGFRVPWVPHPAIGWVDVSAGQMHAQSTLGPALSDIVRSAKLSVTRASLQLHVLTLRYFLTCHPERRRHCRRSRRTPTPPIMRLSGGSSRTHSVPRSHVRRRMCHHELSEGSALPRPATMWVGVLYTRVNVGAPSYRPLLAIGWEQDAVITGAASPSCLVILSEGGPAAGVEGPLTRYNPVAILLSL